MKLAGKKVVITGATGGIGGAIAQALDLAGCHLLLTGRSSDKLDSLLLLLQGNSHLSLVADLTTKAGIDSLNEASQRFDATILINCLGVNQLATLDNTKESDINYLLATNLNAPIHVCQSLLPLFKSQPKATIVNVGSILGSIGYAGSTLYCASKFGLRGFTESLRRELTDSKINVIYFAPRATNTELNSDEISGMNRALKNTVDSPEQVAKLLVSVLAADKPVNRYVGWPERLFVFINAIFPSMVDNALSKQLTTIKRHCKPKQSK